MIRLINIIFYTLKPIIPRFLQIKIRRIIVYILRRKHKDIWPITPNASTKPKTFINWPNDKKFALVLTHDVESPLGIERCRELADIDKKMGFVSSFNFVLEKYDVPVELRAYLVNNGFEIGIHGLKHDGKLYFSKRMFKKRTSLINRYIKEWNVKGFRSPAMHHNLEWIHEFDIEYDLSTFDTDPFEPQPDGVNTIFPFSVNGSRIGEHYIELPYTLPQDFTLFILMKEWDISIWKKKLEWIAEKGGMALLITHPDYMNFSMKKTAIDEYPVNLYTNFLNHVKTTYKDQYWHALPREVAKLWKVREGKVLGLG